MPAEMLMPPAANEPELFRLVRLAEEFAQVKEREIREALDRAFPGWTLDEVRVHGRMVLKGPSVEVFLFRGRALVEFEVVVPADKASIGLTVKRDIPGASNE